MTPAELKAEIQTGPHAATLAPYVTAGNDAAIAAFLNNANGAGAGIITLPTIDKRRLMKGLMPLLIKLATQTTAIQGKWDRLLNVLHSMDVADVAITDQILALAVSEAFITQAQSDAIRTRTGSRAEVLGTTIDIQQIASALRG